VRWQHVIKVDRERPLVALKKFAEVFNQTVANIYFFFRRIHINFLTYAIKSIFKRPYNAVHVAFLYITTS